MRFEPGSPVSELIRTVPYIAFQVDDLETALHGKEIISDVSSPADRVRVVMILHNGAPVEVHEILGLRLSARLVVLSACDTALGSGYFAEVPAGDDLVGLTRAFLFAGSPSVMASLWAVNDRSTMQLMSGFYGQLVGTDKATALATAQRDLIGRGGRFSHPYFWGAFVLVGRMK
jgi:CHAT domain-containing protein